MPFTWEESVHCLSVKKNCILFSQKHFFMLLTDHFFVYKVIQLYSHQNIHKVHSSMLVVKYILLNQIHQVNIRVGIRQLSLPSICWDSPGEFAVFAWQTWSMNVCMKFQLNAKIFYLDNVREEHFNIILFYNLMPHMLDSQLWMNVYLVNLTW